MNIPDNIFHQIVKNAVKENNLQFFKDLIESGFDINQKDESGETILFTVTHNDCMHVYEITKYLIENGADVNAKNNSGETILHESYTMDEDTLQLLLKNGADVNAKDQYGHTPLFYANATSTDFLLEHGADINEADSFFGIMNSFDHPSVAQDIIISLIDHGADINQKDNYGKTILQRVQEILAEDEFENDWEKDDFENFEQELLSRGAK